MRERLTAQDFQVSSLKTFRLAKFRCIFLPFCTVRFIFVGRFGTFLANIDPFDSHFAGRAFPHSDRHNPRSAFTAALLPLTFPFAFHFQFVAPLFADVQLSVRPSIHRSHGAILKASRATGGGLVLGALAAYLRSLQFQSRIGATRHSVI